MPDEPIELPPGFIGGDEGDGGGESTSTPPASPNGINPMEILQKIGYGEKFKSPDEITNVLKERDTFNTHLESLSKRAREAGFNSVQEMMLAAAEKKNAGNASNKGLDFSEIVNRLMFQKYGAQADNPQLKQWAGFFSDLLKEGLDGSFAEREKKWEIDAMRNVVFGLKDEMDLVHFLMDPANAELDRSILPELKSLYQREELWKRPEFHDGEWNGYRTAYQRLLDLHKKLGGGQPAAPNAPRMPKPGSSPASHPPNPKKVPAGNGNRRTSRTDEFLKGPGRELLNDRGQVDHTRFLLGGDEESFDDE